MKRKSLKSPKRSSQVPVTIAMMERMENRLTNKMHAIRDDLRSDIQGVRADVHEIKSEVHGVKSEIHELRSEIQGMKSDIHAMKSKDDGIRSDLQEVKAEMHRLGLLIEEQNARNKYVLDGYAQIYEMIRRDRDL